MKYKTVAIHDTLLDIKCWEDIFHKGVMNRDLIEQSIQKSSYFKDETTQSWVKLWHFQDFSDEEYVEIVKNVEEEYYAKRYDEIGIIKHVTGLFLFLSGEELYDKQKDDILNFAKEYVDHLILHGKLSLEPKEHITLLDKESWSGLDFYGKEIPEFKILIEYLDDKINKARIDKMPEVGKFLIKTMETDTPLFFRMLTFSDTADQKYYDVPILKNIVPSDFVESFLRLKPDNRKLINSTIRQRYKFTDLNQILIKECDWWRSIRSLFYKKMEEYRGKPTRYVLQNFIDLIQKLINTLENTPEQK